MADDLPQRDESPLDPATALRFADHPRLDPLTRVHFALDAGFRDPDFTQYEAALLAGVGTRRLRYILDGAETNYRLEIDRRRMALAKELLADTSFLTSAVAELCGYRNLSAFGKRFKEHTGMTPVAFRVGVSGGPRRAGGPTGAAKNAAARTRAEREGLPVPSTRRTSWAHGEPEVFLSEYDHAVRQARAFGSLPRHGGGLSIEETVAARNGKRRRGASG